LEKYGYVQMHLERCIADMWYELVVVTDFVEFCGYPLCFWLSIADKMKEGKLIHD